MLLRSIASMSLLNVAKAAAALLISVGIAARVAPAEFGLVAFAVPLMALLTLLTDLGLSSAIVRHPALDRRQAGAVLSLLGGAGAVGGALLALGAARLEQALQLPGLTPVLQGLPASPRCPSGPPRRARCWSAAWPIRASRRSRRSRCWAGWRCLPARCRCRPA